MILSSTAREAAIWLVLISLETTFATLLVTFLLKNAQVQSLLYQQCYLYLQRDISYIFCLIYILRLTLFNCRPITSLQHDSTVFKDNRVDGWNNIPTIFNLILLAVTEFLAWPQVYALVAHFLLSLQHQPFYPLDYQQTFSARVDWKCLHVCCYFDLSCLSSY